MKKNKDFNLNRPQNEFYKKCKSLGYDCTLKVLENTKEYLRIGLIVRNKDNRTFTMSTTLGNKNLLEQNLRLLYKYAYGIVLKEEINQIWHNFDWDKYQVKENSES